MNFIHDLPSQINRMVVKDHILSKIMQKLKINRGIKHEMDSMLSCSTDDKTSKNRLEVQIMKNADGRIRTCEGTKPLAPEASPLDRSGTSANNHIELYALFLNLLFPMSRF